MPRGKLTDSAIRAVQAPPSGQVVHWDATLPGFGLRVACGGAKTWIAMYRQGGRLRRLTLGRYPVVGLADARERARDVLASVVKGEDPAAEKQAEREASTFGQVAAEYMERHAKAK